MDGIDIPPALPPNKRTREDTQAKFDELVREGEDLIDAATKDMDDLENSRREIRSSIESEFKRLREVIDSAETSLYKSLEEIYNEQENHLHDVIYDLQNTIQKLKDITSNQDSQHQPNSQSFQLQLSTILNPSEDAINANSPKEVAEAMVTIRQSYDQARATLMMKRTHHFVKPPHELRIGDYRLDTTVSVRSIPFAPIEVTTGPLQHGAIRLRWVPSAYQSAQLERAGLAGSVRYQVQTREQGTHSFENAAECGACDVMYFPAKLAPGKKYDVLVRAGCGGVWSPWSRPAPVTVPDWARWCAWKECPVSVDPVLAYKVSGAPRRWATQTGDYWCTVVGNTPLGRNAVVSWGTKIIVSKDRNGAGIFVGVAPEDINQSEDENFEKCGWYINCGDFTLHSGPPHNYGYDGPSFGKRKKYGTYVTTGDALMTTVNTSVGTIAFAIRSPNASKNEDIGVAYKGVPLDKPLVPAVIMFYKKDAIELLI